jgi:hypothetical protein
MSTFTIHRLTLSTTSYYATGQGSNSLRVGVCRAEVVDELNVEGILAL